MTRRKIRQKVLQVLYAHQMSKDSIDQTIADQLSDIEEEEEQLFANLLIKLVLDNGQEYDKIISSIVSNWEIERIAIIDHIIIKICMSEFFHMENIPAKVSINEAIDLAKNFSTKNSGRFVNGILDSILIKMREKGEIKKTGRGIVGDSDIKKTSKRPVAINENNNRIPYPKNTKKK